VLIDKNDLPKHLFGIPDLDLSDDLCAERLAGPWFRLGACSTGSGRDKQGVENVVYRQSMLLSPEDFRVIFDQSLLLAISANRADRLSAMAIARLGI
jgi:hypothetical protein